MKSFYLEQWHLHVQGDTVLWLFFMVVHHCHVIALKTHEKMYTIKTFVIVIAIIVFIIFRLIIIITIVLPAIVVIVVVVIIIVVVIITFRIMSG
jgi:hypothetical protein